MLTLLPVTVLATAVPAAADHPGVVTVTVTRVTNVGDEGIEDNLRGPADMYAFVVIDGQSFDSKAVHVDDDDDIEPFWVFSASLGAGRPDNVAVRIEIWDHDDCDPPRCGDGGIFGSGDDQGDVDPNPGDDALDLVVDRTTGSFSGDVTGTCAQGDDTSGGDRRVRVCFDVSTTSASGDADGDGLLDGWETNGFDADGDGTIDLDLPSLGANPLHKDLFLELDYAAGQAPRRADIQAMKAAFAAAPTTAGQNASALTGGEGGPGVNAPPNPDGQPGITLHVDTGTLVDANASEGAPTGSCTDGADNGGDGTTDGADPDCANTAGSRNFLESAVEDPPAGNCGDGVDNDGDGQADGADGDCLVGDNLGGGNQVAAPNACGLDANFYNTKTNNFDAANRRWIFRYSISAAQGGGCSPSGGQGEIGGNDFIDFNHDGGTIMHELGHTLNLHHGGNVDDNCKPNFVSVMNYDLQFGIQRNGGGAILDYAPARRALNGSTRSTAPLPQLVENDLDEPTILEAADANNRFVFVDGTGQKVQNPLNTAPNWNADADPPSETNLTVNIDTSGTNGRPQACTNGATNSTLNGFDDWSAVSMAFRQFGDAADSAINPESDQVPTLQDREQMLNELNTTDVGIDISDAPDPVAAGTQLTYNMAATNHGPNPASLTQVVLTLPTDVSFANASPECTAAGTMVTCNLGELSAEQVRMLTVTVNVPADLVYNNGGPKSIAASATVDNLAGPDPAPGNDSDSETTQVIAVADVRINTVSTSSPLEVLIGQPASATVDVGIENAGPSSPIDTVLTGSASSSSGVTVSPTNTLSNENALAVGAPRTVRQTFTLTCTTPGSKTVSFNYNLALVNAADSDPDLTNNDGSAPFVIDCVVPIAINIRPGGFPNSINLNTDATLAALTTRAGEYGLPLDFDATTIDITTVRFGLRNSLFNVATPAGGLEVHGTAHLEDSFELDERTRDGDTDAVMHFKPPESGLTVGTTEACLKGKFTSASGTFTFLGCDSVRVRR